MGLIKRIARVTAGAVMLLSWFTVGEANATPIQPDINKILTQPQEDSVRFPVARAGWDGPPASASPAAPNPTLEQIGPDASVRDAHRALKTAAVPDYRAVAGILLVILLLRRMQAPKAPPKTEPADDVDLRRAA